jgi:hypothetical protein
MAVAVLSGVYLVLLWIVSSLFLGKGLVVFAVGCVLLAAALTGLRRGQRIHFYRLSLAMGLAAATTIGAEVVLWVAPGLLSGRLANAAYSGYHLARDGIYMRDLYVGEIMRPNFHRRMYWNGHWWEHQTNRDGFRGPTIRRADVVFLGDSMIYGHGVDQSETVPALFEDLTGCVSANLGRQGASMVQELELLRRLGLRLSPRVIVVSSHPTDPEDGEKRYSRSELERFLTEDGYRPVAIQPDKSTESIFDWWLAKITLPMRSGRALRAVVRPKTVAGHATAGDGPFVPTDFQLAEPFEPSTPRERLGWEAHVRSLEEMKCAADELGARLVLMDLGYPRSFSRAVRAVADDLGAAYSDAGAQALDLSLAGEPIYLARDGHWAPDGSLAVARALAEVIGNCDP